MSSIAAILIGPMVTVAPIGGTPTTAVSSAAAADSIWDDPVVVSRPDTDVQNAAIAGNERGDVAAVWLRLGFGPTIEFAHFDPVRADGRRSP
jgi:hypothetical protein